jgi:hypothetical protein
MECWRDGKPFHALVGGKQSATDAGGKAITATMDGGMVQ